MSCLCNPGCFEKLKSLCGNLEIPCGKASPSVSAVEAADTSPSPPGGAFSVPVWLLLMLPREESLAPCRGGSSWRCSRLCILLSGCSRWVGADALDCPVREALMSSVLHQWSSAVLCLEMKWHYRPREACSNYSASGWVKATAAGAGSSVAVRTRPCCPPALRGGWWAVGWDSVIHHRCLVPWAGSDCHPHLIIWALNQTVSQAALMPPTPVAVKPDLLPFSW